jgi:hypothetical protein
MGSFWWKDIFRLCDLFRGIAKCNVGNDTSALFWADVWNDNLLQLKLLRLYSFAKDKNISDAQFFTQEHLEDHFDLPLSPQAFLEF